MQAREEVCGTDLTRPVRGKSQQVAICVCTCKRPKMLERCLQSLISQAVPSSVTPFIVVIDNDPAGSAEAVIGRAMTDRSPFPIHARHEPRQGIAIARNAALEEAVKLNADWIAFIDDDEWAEPDWIAELMAPEYLDVPVLMGMQIMVQPDPAPFWALPPAREKRRREGHRMKTAYTHNVRFSISLVLYGPQRFNEGLGAMGGEDNEFFATAHLMGFGIRRTLRAVTYETAHRERLTFGGQFYRAYWNAASEVRRLACEHGHAGAILRKAHSIPVHFVFGAGELALSPLFAIGGLTPFKRRAIAGGKKIAKGFGRATAMLGRLPQPYRVVVGE